MKTMVFFISLLGSLAYAGLNSNLILDFKGSYAAQKTDVEVVQFDCGNYYDGVLCVVKVEKPSSSEFCEEHYEYRGGENLGLSKELCFKAALDTASLIEKAMMLKVRSFIESAYEKGLYPYGGELLGTSCKTVQALPVCTTKTQFQDEEEPATSVCTEVFSMSKDEKIQVQKPKCED